MKDNATGDVKITYYSSCLTNGQLVKTNKCSGLKVGDKVTFTANITVTKCPTNPRDWNQVCIFDYKNYPGVNNICDKSKLLTDECFFFVHISGYTNLSSGYQ